MMEDDGRVLESPLSGNLYYVTKYEAKGDGKFVSKEKQRINWPDNTSTEQ